MKRTKYILKFDGVILNNRWKRPFYSRPGSWVIIGFSKKYFSVSELEYVVSFFGLDILFWFTLIIKNEQNGK